MRLVQRWSQTSKVRAESLFHLADGSIRGHSLPDSSSLHQQATMTLATHLVACLIALALIPARCEKGEK